MSTSSTQFYQAYRQALLVLKNRWRQGIRRIQGRFGQLLQAALAATCAYAFAVFVLGHQYPFLAAVAAAVGVGVVADLRVRRAIEFSIGAVLGVTVGEVMVHLLGTGVWQIFVVMMLTFLVAQMLNSGALFTMQFGIQSIYVVVVPATTGSAPFERTQDAVVGGVVALLVAGLMPRDPRREPRRNASALLREIAEILDELSDAARRSDPHAAERALTRGRDSQGLVENWEKSAKIAQEAARISPAQRRHAAEVSRLARACEYADRAMRLVRVVARRMQSAAAEGVPRPKLADAVSTMAEGARELNQALLKGSSREEAQRILSEAAAILDPRNLTVKDLQGDSLVLLLRPMAVDLLQAAGLTSSAAVKRLPDL
ncbi:FUSC family protein [Saxibacter everestensis]|uniref:FUSC family protein n=1 Tax=Saxibacter everestensis TaxID=2909229 RepID=A0ABY8QW86_9MICO|nr:FUSC family protein [Brevibacteriaceae bacterium ZFBP1038]